MKIQRQQPDGCLPVFTTPEEFYALPTVALQCAAIRAMTQSERHKLFYARPETVGAQCYGGYNQRWDQWAKANAAAVEAWCDEQDRRANLSGPTETPQTALPHPVAARLSAEPHGQ